MTDKRSKQIHATCVDVDGYGVILMGDPGSGKSDLALRLLRDERNRLVADDRVELEVRSGLLRASPPATLAGKLEVRGVGIVEREYLPETTVRLAVALVDRGAVDRLPEPQAIEWLGLSIPLLNLHAFDASAPDKVQAALIRRGGHAIGGTR